MHRPKVIFRADGNTQIGLGHIFRCLALAEMLKDDFRCVFASRPTADGVKAQIKAVCGDLITLDEQTHFEDFLNHLQGDEIVVLDNYFYFPKYQKAIISRGCKLVHIDDMQPYHYHAHVVVNHAPGLNSKMFSLDAHTSLCTGLDYALLRKPFRSAVSKHSELYQSSQYDVFICFGGSDIHNISLKVIEALANHPLIRTMHVVLGPAYPHRDIIIKKVEHVPQIQLHNQLNGEEMLTLMQRCNLAIVPSSTILYELTAARIYTISGYYVDNQKNIYEGFLKENLIAGVGNYLTFEAYGELLDRISLDDRRNLLDRQQEKLNTDPAVNFVNLFKALAHESSVISR